MLKSYSTWQVKSGYELVFPDVELLSCSLLFYGPGNRSVDWALLRRTLVLVSRYSAGLTVLRSTLSRLRA